MALKRVTMQDIADACGLSRNTVSKIFNGRGAVPEVTQKMVLSKAKELIQNMEFTADTMSIDIPPMGKLVVEIIEREPEKLVKLTSTQSPIPLTVWIQLVPTSETSCAMRLTLEAELNMFLKMAIGGKLKEGVDKFADMLAKIPYGE